MISKTALTTLTAVMMLTGAATLHIGQYGLLNGTANVQPPASLTGWWKFDEGTGNTLSDSSSYSNDGTLYGNYIWSTKGVSFDGNQSYAEIPVNITGYTEITVSYWANLTDESYSQDERIFSSGGSGQEQILLWPNSNDGPTGLSWNVWTGSDKQRLDSAAKPEGWTMVTGTWNGSEMKLYANDQQVGTTVQFTGDGTIGSTSSVLIAKSGSTTETQFEGSVSDLKIYDITLQENDISLLFNQSCNNYGACN